MNGVDVGARAAPCQLQHRASDSANKTMRICRRPAPAPAAPAPPTTGYIQIPIANITPPLHKSLPDNPEHTLTPNARVAFHPWKQLWSLCMMNAVA